MKARSNGSIEVQILFGEPVIVGSHSWHFQPMKTKQQVIHYINSGDTLADLIARAIESGVTEKDFSEVRVEMDYRSCCTCTDSDDYCYCDSAYDNVRLQRSK